MSILKRRAELLEELIASTAQLTPGHSQFDALARSCKEQIDFHSFLDTNSNVVNAEYAQLKERLEDNAQFDKVTAIAILSSRLQNLNLASSQLDFASRQLSFLLAASRNVLRTVVDPEILAQGRGTTTAASIPHPSEWTDDEDDSDAEWWANEVSYSPEDGLSAWSGDEEDDGGDGEARGRSTAAPPPGGGVGGLEADGSSSLSPGGGTRAGTKPSFITDPTNSPLTPLSISRTSRRSPTRGRQQHHHLSPQRRVKHPYGSTSLAVWLAAKDSGGHPARQLDPRRCFTDSELVLQVINMLKGLLMPGLAFKFEQETESYKVCRGVHTSDLPPVSTASLLTTFTSLATHLRRIQTFCDAIVFTSASDNLPGNANIVKKSDTIALRALPTVAAFAASVSRQVVAIRGQLIDLETTATMNNLLSLRLKLALMTRQVAALHAVVKECYWRGTAAYTASVLLDTLYSVLEMHLMRSGEHSGAVAGMLVQIFCAAWKPLNDALDAWLRHGSFVDAPPEFYITQKTTETNRTSIFWRDQYQLQPPPPPQQMENEKNSVAVPALLAPFAESLLQAGLASVGLTLSSDFEQQQPEKSSILSLHTEFVESLSVLIEKKPSISSPSIAGTTPTSTITTVATSMSSNSMENGDFKDGLCLKQWTAAVSRSPATALVPLAEDISDLSLFPTSVLDLPEAYMCPEITALMRGGEQGENEETKKHPVAVAMSMASAARAQQAAAGKTDVVIAAEFDDILNTSHEEVFGGAGRKYFSTITASLAAAGAQKRQESSNIALDAASWATSLPLEVLTQVCLVDPIHKRMKYAEKRACEAILHAGLLTQLKTMEMVAAAAGPVLDPFVQYLLRNSSTPRGVDGMSPFELHSALANALTQAGEQALPGLASVAVEIAPAVDSSGTTLLPSNKVCSISSLRRIIPTLHPSFPLNLIANDSFLQLHTMLWTLSLQLQWVVQSLIAARVGLWKEHQKDTNNNSSTSSTRAAQQEMLHLVHSVRQHMLTQVESSGVRMRRGIATCSNVREMEQQCRVYEEELRLGCLLRFQTETHDAIFSASSSFAASSSELYSLLLEVLESSLRHCILLGHARQARSAVNKTKQAQLDAEDAEEEAVALDALEPAQEKLIQISLAVAATEREFEGHRIAFMERVAVYGNEAGAHSEALKALLAAVDLEGRWQPPPPEEEEN